MHLKVQYFSQMYSRVTTYCISPYGNRHLILYVDSSLLQGYVGEKYGLTMQLSILMNLHSHCIGAQHLLGLNKKILSLSTGKTILISSTQMGG